MEMELGVANLQVKRGVFCLVKESHWPIPVAARSKA